MNLAQYCNKQKIRCKATARRNVDFIFFTPSTNPVARPIIYFGVSIRRISKKLRYANSLVFKDLIRSSKLKFLKVNKKVGIEKFKTLLEAIEYSRKLEEEGFKGITIKKKKGSGYLVKRNLTNEIFALLKFKCKFSLRAKK